METKITKEARDELAQAVRKRYRTATSRDERKRMLSEFIALTGYHPKSAVRVLNRDDTEPRAKATRNRPRLYDEAARQALIVMWEASDRVCGKRLQPLLRTLLPAMERHGHLRLEPALREQILKMSSATIDRLLRVPKATTRTKKARRTQPEIRRRIPVRTFGDWNSPLPGCMEMDLVAHCGEVNRGSYLYSLVMTDIATGWTECAPLVVRESSLLIETLNRVRLTLPFPLRALDTDNGSEFVNESLIKYCLAHGIELTRSRPWLKNDQAWIEQKNGAVVRRMPGSRRFEGVATAQTLGRLYAALRFFVNFFQTSFKLAGKSREGAYVSRRYHAPETPCERLLGHESVPGPTKLRLKEVFEQLDPIRLLEEIRTMQSNLIVLADGGQMAAPCADEPDLAHFLASLSTAWRDGEVRPTYAENTNPLRYVRQTKPGINTTPVISPTLPSIIPAETAAPPAVAVPTPSSAVKIEAAAPLVPMQLEAPSPIVRKHRRPCRTYRKIWPQICLWLEQRPNLSASFMLDLLEPLYPGVFKRSQRNTLHRWIMKWRKAAIARGVTIGPKLYRKTPGRPPRKRTLPDPFAADWAEMCAILEADPDQTGIELFEEIQSRYPGKYLPGQLRTVQRRLKAWRAEAARRLVFDVDDASLNVQLQHS